MSAALPIPPLKIEEPPARAMIVSVHDVSPLTRAATERILAELGELGIHGCSLLVVPDHHRKGHVLDDPEFCAWLKTRVTAGDEVVIHGYFHRRDRRANESFRDKLTTRFYTAGEGEFFDKAGADSLWIISQARDEFRKIGLDPHGFIAPAWLLSDGSERALRKLGFAYTTRLGTVTDFHGERTYCSQSLVWSVRSFWRRAISRWWNASLFRRLRPCPLLRIGIHPPDIAHPAIWRQITALATQALADRTPLTYLRWVETSRSQPAHVLQS